MSATVRVKICGVQQPADALAAVEAGADFVGMVFVPERRRRLDTAAAQAVTAALRECAPATPPIVGLFADQPVGEVNRMVRDCGLDMVQLCGLETTEYCGQVEVPVIKVLHISPSWEVEYAVASLSAQMLALSELGHWITLDRRVEGLQGGTGEAFNWDIARRLSDQGYHFLLAGGLSPGNVVEAVRTARPWGVDVSSGVETQGHKDPGKIAAFITTAQSVPG